MQYLKQDNNSLALLFLLIFQHHIYVYSLFLDSVNLNVTYPKSKCVKDFTDMQMSGGNILPKFKIMGSCAVILKSLLSV
jgi:hypothetical protein